VCPETPPERPSIFSPTPGLQGKVVGAVLSQHDHDMYIECVGAMGYPGECEFDGPGEPRQHLVVYVGLNSHANFPYPTNGTIFGALRNDQKLYKSSRHGQGEMLKGRGMEGVVALDRAAKGGPKWVPNHSNVVKLPELQAPARMRRRGLKKKARGTSWADYPGFW